MESKSLSRRGFLRLSAAGLAGAALAACGAAPTATPAPMPTAVKPAAAPTAVPAAPAKKVALKFLSPDVGSGQLEWMEGTLIPNFIKANATVEKIDVISTDYTKINEVLLAGFAAGDPADLFEHGSSASGASWAASGQTLVLDDFFAQLSNKSDYFDPAIKYSYFNGKLYSLPRTVTPNAIVYRKDWFKDAGLDPAKPPKTWDELRQYAKALVKTSGDKVTRAGYWTPTSSWDGVQMGWFSYLHQNGVSILSDDLTKTAFDSAAGIEAMNFYHDLLWKDKVDVLGGLPSAIAGNPVAVGNAAMSTADPGIIPILTKNFPDILPQIAVAPPTSKVRPGCMLACNRTFISLKSKAPDVAWKFLAFKDSMSSQLERYKLTAALPPLKTFLTSDVVTSSPLLQAFLKNVEVGFQWPPSAKWNDFRSQITTMSDGFLAQAGPVDDFVKNGAKEINAILSKT
jgi:multiple sugar transport system substrate-binding protein